MTGNTRQDQPLCPGPLSRTKSLDQGGACGAAGPAPAPGSASSRPARRAPGRTSLDTHLKMAQTNIGQVWRPSSSLPIVLLAATASMAALRSAARAIGYADH